MGFTSEFYEKVREVSEALYYRALTVIPKDVVEKIRLSYDTEDSPLGKEVMDTIIKNIEVARKRSLLVCQDTGTPVYLVELGDVEISLPKLIRAIKEGVRDATVKNHLRPNMVHPITRVNTGDNTGRSSPIVHVELNEGLKGVMKIVALPKGSGSENMSALAMLRPADGLKGVKRFVLETVANAGGKGCPPYIVGVGIGGDFEQVTYLAKKGALRPLGSRSEDEIGRKMEDELFLLINKLGVGPMGVGGKITALGVNVEIAETHISSLPVAVNIQCWRGERAEAIIGEDLSIKYLGG
ncbi:hydro-lyase, Fe-S type, tartrate/fumarate subfamily [Metallosphaera yellowstonensis MK1]|jgi:tartrate/fumarate subfamily iron-sulfur-dependent hydro-lyase alpha chain|uniref:Hydro-lyase, Fe-S type, tartrate/fumarate subfamily n=1 Tax=Metallosphaera yellowstonensis MK1 TaxID=671065 RepID=H2C0N1_9CREN|nr:fumarate hydratase [Metallosphaera yellowstonensis]EHP71293.1 hydro-lyase, Fe-S type, tartrate/fumarate subfamily [Metallosphaera yellowstonensis MK1]